MSVILGIFLGVIFFSAQGILCARSSSLIVKLIPSALAVLFFLGAIASEGVLAGIALTVMSVICLLGVGGAWLIYYLSRKGG